MLIARHGEASHYMRPDRVYRTGVLAPMAGFSPQQDVMGVAAEFTQGPALFMQGDNPGLGRPPIQFLGFGAPISNLGFLQKAWIKFTAWRTRMQAKKFGFSGLDPFGPQDWAGGRVVPMANERAEMLMQMQAHNQPQIFAARNTDQIAMRWMHLRSSTR